MKTTLRAVAFHEAGHAAAAGNMGYRVREICVRKLGDDNWSGAICYEAEDFTCETGHSLQGDRSLAPELAKLPRDCAYCEDERRRFGVRVLAANFATEQLCPEDHNQSYADHDRCALFEAYGHPQGVDRDRIWNECSEAARKAVEPIGGAIKKLAEHLIAKAESAPEGSVVCGPGDKSRQLLGPEMVPDE